MNNVFLRTAAIVLHTILNAMAVSYVTDYDLTGSWLRFLLFLLFAVMLVFLFARHIISYIQFLKLR